MAFDWNRRKFLTTASASAAALTIVPRHVLGGPGFVAPSAKIALAHIGFGTQSIREVGALLAHPEIQIVAVCDPEKDGTHYVEWGKKGRLRDVVRKLLENPRWREGVDHVPGGRDVGQEIVETYYAKQRAADKFKGCAAYADFRELLEKEKDIDAVKIMTPDHLHAAVAIAAMKKGKHVVVHKPLANRVLEARLVVETARKTKVATHFLPASEGAQIRWIAEMIKDGAIGTLRELHNWSSRPMWPHYPLIPTDTPPIPKDFDWTLWLGPALDRPYHPHYTHTNFRGWYEFGGGPIADMGHYSLWPVFQIFALDAPISVESTPSHLCTIIDEAAERIRNDYSYPVACTIRWGFAAKGDRPAIDLCWYDGGMRPPVPQELLAENKELQAEGMMLVGDHGKILAGFRGEDPQIIPAAKMRAYRAAKNLPTDSPRERARGGASHELAWVPAFKGGPPTYGDFLLAGPISDTVNLGAISLRLGGKRLLWDAANAKITNVPEANKYLSREYRKGWELTG
jgi:predicted dehydrogenase